MRGTFTIILGLALAVRVFAATETLTNNSVIELQKVGLAEDLIFDKIKNSQGEFDLSTDGLKQLKAAGVSDSIIRAMMSISHPQAETPKAQPTMAAVSNDPLVSHETGLWLYQEVDGQPKMTRLKPKDAGRSSGWNKKSRATLYGAAATLQTGDGRPTFYYYTPASDADADANDLVLARLEVRADKNDRRLAVGKQEFFGGTKSGLDPKAFVATTADKVALGIFKIIPTQDLTRGEYCFIHNADASREALKHGQVDLFDFGIKAKQ